MIMTEMTDTLDGLVAAATAGNEAAFSELTERHRRELQVHLYRMTGSLDDSEDLVQETFLRAWRGARPTRAVRRTGHGCTGSPPTPASDALERRPRQGARPRPAAAAEVPWLQPYPDDLLEAIAPRDAEPDAAVVAKETIELAFLAAIQHLPPRPRAVLILCDVLGWSAKDAAALLEGSVASVNSALQRARAALRQRLPERRTEWAPGTDPSEQERALLRRFVAATERADADASST